MIEITMWAAIALTILASMRSIYGAYECPKRSALILCAGIGVAYAVWLGLDLKPVVCQMVIAYLLYACASIVWTKNKKIAIDALYQRAAFIFFFLVACNVKEPFRSMTLWVIAVSAGISSLWAFYKWFIKSRWDKNLYTKHRKSYGTMGNTWKASTVYIPAFFVALHLTLTQPLGSPEGILAVAATVLTLSGIIHSKCRSSIIGMFAGCGYLIIY